MNRLTGQDLRAARVLVAKAYNQIRRTMQDHEGKEKWNDGVLQIRADLRLAVLHLHAAEECMEEKDKV